MWSAVVGYVISSLAGVTVALFASWQSDRRASRRSFRETVWRTLFNELDSAIRSGGEDAVETGRSIWLDLDPYTKSRVPPALRKALDGYADRRRRYRDSVSGHREAIKSDAVSLNAAAAVFQSVLNAVGMMPESDRDITLPSGRTFDINIWAEVFFEPLVLASSPDDLVEMMANCPQANQLDIARFIPPWAEENDAIGPKLLEVRERLNSRISRHSRSIAQTLRDDRQEFIKRVEPVRNIVKKQLDRSWIRDLISIADQG